MNNPLRELPQGRGPGMWRLILLDEFGDLPRWSAIICCPNCHTMLPIPNHTIAADGEVTPSVGHPIRECGWHVSPKLLGWQGGRLAPGPRPFYECTGCKATTRQLNGWGVFGGLKCPSCLPSSGKVK